MLYPEDITSLPDDVTNIWHLWEQGVLIDLAKRIKDTNYLIPTAIWNLEKVTQLRLHQEYSVKELSKMTQKSEEVIQGIMQDAFKRGLQSDLDIISKIIDVSGKDLHYEELYKEAMNGIHKVNTTIRNFTGSYAASLSKTYENALDLAYLNTATGVMSKDQSVKQAVKSLFNQNNLPKLVTKDGRQEQIKTVVARAVRTGTNQSMAKIQIMNLKNLDCDLVETTSHYGARPSHTIWQGRVFSISGKHPRYPAFKSSTGFGTGDGLCGWNCRHSFFPYFEGLSEQSFKPIQDSEMERLNLEKRLLTNQLKAIDTQEKVYQSVGYSELTLTEKKKGIKEELSSIQHSIQEKERSIKRSSKSTNVSPDENTVYKKLMDFDGVSKGKQFSNKNVILHRLKNHKNFFANKTITREEYLQIKNLVNDSCNMIGDSLKSITCLIFKDGAYPKHETLASMNVETLELSINLDTLNTLSRQEQLVTILHELFHRQDSMRFRKNYSNLEDYDNFLNNRAKEELDKLEKSGYNIYKISTYAARKYLDGAFDETYTEYRAYDLLRKKGARK